jgi:GNAT superfamily N-acetyltransferase
MFDGSLEDAKGLLNVERATFNECPYTARQLQVMLTRGAQRAWLALDDDEMCGFVVAFPIANLQGLWWEIDLLAVHPDWEGQGIGRELIRSAAGAGSDLGCRARAVISDRNPRSARAFAAAGFQQTPDPCSLLIYRLDGPVPRGYPVPGLAVRKASGPEEIAPLLPGGVVPAEYSTLPAGVRRSTLLMAEQNGRLVGYAEVIDVQTILYRGTWIESLVAPSRTVREALVYYTLGRAESKERDEVSALVSEHGRPLQHTLLAAGFRLQGEYRWFTASLPVLERAGSDRARE